VDITARKRAEAAFRESEDHYRNTVQLNPQILWICDPQGMNVEIGSRWEQITGMNQEQTREYGWLAALPEEDVNRILPLIRHCLLTGDPIDIEYRVHGKDGGWRWMRSRGNPQRGESGEILRWYGCVDDIDAYKKLAEILRKCEAKNSSSKKTR
jgi:PAS domain S-box-containing protein